MDDTGDAFGECGQRAVEHAGDLILGYVCRKVDREVIRYGGENNDGADEDSGEEGEENVEGPSPNHNGKRKEGRRKEGPASGGLSKKMQEDLPSAAFARASPNISIPQHVMEAVPPVISRIATPRPGAPLRSAADLILDALLTDSDAPEVVAHRPTPR